MVNSCIRDGQNRDKRKKRVCACEVYRKQKHFTEATQVGWLFLEVKQLLLNLGSEDKKTEIRKDKKT